MGSHLSPEGPGSIQLDHNGVVLCSPHSWLRPGPPTTTWPQTAWEKSPRSPSGGTTHALGLPVRAWPGPLGPSHQLSLPSPPGSLGAGGLGCRRESPEEGFLNSPKPWLWACPGRRGREGDHSPEPQKGLCPPGCHLPAPQPEPRLGLLGVGSQPAPVLCDLGKLCSLCASASSSSCETGWWWAVWSSGVMPFGQRRHPVGDPFALMACTSPALSCPKEATSQLRDGRAGAW